MQTVTKGEGGIVRVCAHDRTELRELEMEISFHYIIHLSFILTALDCSPANYLIWIEEEKPRLGKWVDEIRKVIFTQGLLISEQFLIKLLGPKSNQD